MAETDSTPLTCTAKLKDGGTCSHDRADQNPSATNRHCKKHRALAQRAYVETRATRDRGKGYVRGVEDMRSVLVTEFSAQGPSSFTGAEISLLIRQAPGPLFRQINAVDMAEVPSDDDAAADLDDAELPSQTLS